MSSLNLGFLSYEGRATSLSGVVKLVNFSSIAASNTTRIQCPDRHSAGAAAQKRQVNYHTDFKKGALPFARRNFYINGDVV